MSNIQIGRGGVGRGGGEIKKKSGKKMHLQGHLSNGVITLSHMSLAPVDYAVHCYQLIPQR